MLSFVELLLNVESHQPVKLLVHLLQLDQLVHVTVGVAVVIDGVVIHILSRLFFGLLLLHDLFLFLPLPERFHVSLTNLAIVGLRSHLHQLGILLFLLFFCPIIVLLDFDGV